MQNIVPSQMFEVCTISCQGNPDERTLHANTEGMIPFKKTVNLRQINRIPFRVVTVKFLFGRTPSIVRPISAVSITLNPRRKQKDVVMVVDTCSIHVEEGLLFQCNPWKFVNLIIPEEEKRKERESVILWFYIKIRFNKKEIMRL